MAKTEPGFDKKKTRDFIELLKQGALSILARTRVPLSRLEILNTVRLSFPSDYGLKRELWEQNPRHAGYFLNRGLYLLEAEGKIRYVHTEQGSKYRFNPKP